MLRYLRALRSTGDNREKTLPYVDPLRAGRHPFQTYLLLLCFVASLPYLVGRASAEAVESNLPTGLAMTWGILLLVGSATALAGTYWRGGYDTALTLERAGLSITGVDGLVYGVAILGGRDPYAPLMAATALFGALLIRIPIRVNNPRHKRLLGDALALIGLTMTVTSSVLLVLTPAREVLVGASIIVGFGLSCLRRASDIASIFVRAKEMKDPTDEPPRIRREGEGSRHGRG